MRVAHIFDAIGDQVARRQRIEHPVVSHRNPIVDGDRIELGGETALFGDPLFDLLSDFMQMHVPGDELSERVDDGDHRLSELFFLHSVCSPETSGSRHFPSRGTDTASEIFHNFRFLVSSLMYCGKISERILFPVFVPRAAYDAQTGITPIISLSSNRLTDIRAL